MSKAGLGHRVDVAIRAVETLNTVPEWETEQRRVQLAHEQVARKIDVAIDETLPASEKAARYAAIDEEVNARKTPEDIKASQRFRLKYADVLAMSRELLIQKLTSLAG